MSQRFIVTKEHRRFTEFADAVRRGHTIGLCFGPAGVGKTLSARRYARWDKVHDLLTYWGPRSDSDAQVYAALAKSRTVLYTPSVLTTPRALKDELDQVITRTNICIEQHLAPAGQVTPETRGWRHSRNYVELVIVDESERLRPTAMELLRDRYDRENLALILIGMPGLEKQFSHYPQSTAASASPTSTGPWARRNCSSSCNGIGAPSVRSSTQRTSPTPKPSPPSPGSPEVTSGFWNDSSPRSSAS